MFKDKIKSVNIQDWAKTSFFSAFREAGHFCIVLVCTCAFKWKHWRNIFHKKNESCLSLRSLGELFLVKVFPDMCITEQYEKKRTFSIFYR